MPSRLAVAIVALAALLLHAAEARAQFEACGSYSDALARIASGDSVDRQITRLTEIGATSYCFTVFVANERALAFDVALFEAFAKRFESARTDKQEASAASGSAATTLVAQGPAARVLAAAVEHGALTQGIEGQTVTLRGNLAGLPSALVRKNVFPYCVAGTQTSEFCVDGSALAILRRVSFAASFDASRGAVTGTAAASDAGADAQPVTFTARRRQLSAASMRFELRNARDLTSKAFQDAWREAVGKAMAQPSTELLESAGAFVEPIRNMPEYDAWQKGTQAALRAAGADPARLVEALRAGLAELAALARRAQPDLDERASRALAAYSRFFLAQDELVDTLSKKHVAALEFTLNRPIGQPETGNLRLILDLPLTTRTKLVLNTAATFYRTRPEGAPAGTGRYRDAQVGVQLEHGLGRQSIVGPAVLSAALYYQYQHAPVLLRVDPLSPVPGITFTDLPAGARTVFTQAGDVVLGQVKLVLAPAGSSVNIPLSITVSNRTELIDKPTWRAQMGVSYDFDALLGMLSTR